MFVAAFRKQPAFCELFGKPEMMMKNNKKIFKTLKNYSSRDTVPLTWRHFKQYKRVF